jgi:hypothetical protein
LPLENVANFERYVRRLVQFLRKKGVTPVLATYPTLVNETNAERYHIEFASSRIYHVEFSEQGWCDTARKLTGVVRRVANEFEVPLVDVDSSMPKTTEFFRDYGHYSNEGAEFVATRVLEVIAQEGLLGPSAARAAADGTPLRNSVRPSPAVLQATGALGFSGRSRPSVLKLASPMLV